MAKGLRMATGVLGILLTAVIALEWNAQSIGENDGCKMKGKSFGGWSHTLMACLGEVPDGKYVIDDRIYRYGERVEGFDGVRLYLYKKYPYLDFLAH